MVLCLFLLLSGCSAPWTAPVGGFVAANAASVVVFGRALPDLVYSGITGRDCSVVRLDEGKSYCRRREPPPAPPPYCTRTLGVVNCWSSPAIFPNPPKGVADGPNTLNAAQEANRTARWPNL